MTIEMKKAALQEFLKGAWAFDDTLTMAPALTHFRPFPEAWTVHEQVVHVLESDIAAFHRYRKAVAEPGGNVIGYDEDRFTQALDYHRLELSDVIAALKLLRKITVRHLEGMVESDWSQIWFNHNSAGRVTLEAWLQGYIDHITFHRKLIDRNVQAFEEQ